MTPEQKAEQKAERDDPLSVCNKNGDDSVSRPTNYIGCDYADLSGADLSGKNLQEAHFRGADLSGANLQGADLFGAHLARANLQGADLTGADLRGADLQGADLEGANISGADFTGADFDNTKGLDFAKLRKENMTTSTTTRLVPNTMCESDLKKVHANIDTPDSDLFDNLFRQALRSCFDEQTFRRYAPTVEIRNSLKAACVLYRSEPVCRN